jgi:hypothetical protein
MRKEFRKSRVAIELEISDSNTVLAFRGRAFKREHTLEGPERMHFDRMGGARKWRTRKVDRGKKKGNAGVACNAGWSFWEIGGENPRPRECRVGE